MNRSVYFAFLCVIGAIAAEAPSAPPTISTVAGTGRKGYSGDGGPAVRAELNMPFDVAFDKNDNLYISDTMNHCIRRVDARARTIETFAGDGTKGFAGDGGPAAKAKLNEPYGLAIDESGNVYLVDRLNNRIRKVDATTGTIATVAGNGTKVYSGDGGPAIAAGLVEPNGIALDRHGRLYIADVRGNRVRMVDTAMGTIQTFAGTGEPKDAGDGGPATNAAVWGPRAVDIAPDGSIYILEREGNRLRKVDAKTGFIATVAGTGAKGYSGDGGAAINATFNGPKEMAVDSAGNIVIVDTENHAARRIEIASGTIRTVAGTGTKGNEGDGGPATAARLGRPHGAAFSSQGILFLGDTENHRIRRVGQ